MTKSSKLKIYRDKSPETLRPDVGQVTSLPAVLTAFREITGWSLRYNRGSKPTHPSENTWSAPVNPGVGVPPGHVTLDQVRSASAISSSHPPTKSTQHLASALAGMLGELLKTQHVLWQREAELAAGVPVSIRSNEPKHLAARLEAVLRAGAEAVGCHAAALYLLDEATTTLKLRSCWGLPNQRLTDPPRPLRGALGDLEAMLGHAVTLEDTGLFQQWNVPEDFPAAACIPIATPTTILGTLWVFCNHRRDFKPRETGILEVVAGRLATDLEREMLMREALQVTQLRRQMAAAERMQQSLIPSTKPVFDGWDFAGSIGSASRPSGAVLDWFVLPDGRLTLAAGEADGHGIEADLAAHTARMALRSHASYHQDASALLREANTTLWTSSVGDMAVSLFCGLVTPDSEEIRCATAGTTASVHLRPDGWEVLTGPTAPLATCQQGVYLETTRRLHPREAIVVFHFDGQANHPAGLPDRAWRVLSQMLAKRPIPSATDLSAAANRYLESLARNCRSRVHLIIKRQKVSNPS